MKLTKKQEKKIESFVWRVYNTFKSTILPIMLSVILVKLQDTPDDTTILLTWELWNAVLYAVVITLAGSVIAGADKVRRV